MEDNKVLSRKEKLERFLMPLGMVGVIFYLVHTILGNILWSEYNPITMDISSLTADGAPNQGILRVFTMIYGICMVLFIIGMIIKSDRKYHLGARTGYVVLLGMEVISLFGYTAFPLVGDKTVMNFQNMMHITVTVAVVVTTIVSGFTLAYGYLVQEKMKNLGKFILIMAIIITLCGIISPISIVMGLNILGLTERLVIYSLQALMFVLSFYYTKCDKQKDLAIILRFYCGYGILMFIKIKFIYKYKVNKINELINNKEGESMAVGEKTLATNKKARHEYFIEETYECGIELKGTEVKSIRAGRVNLKEGFASVDNSEVFLKQVHISPYDQGNSFYKIDPLRVRKLLLHKHEIRKLIGATTIKGYSLVPMRMYLKNGRVKLELGLAKGKKLYDKRQDLAKKDAQRRIEREMTGKY